MRKVRNIVTVIFVIELVSVNAQSSLDSDNALLASPNDHVALGRDALFNSTPANAYGNCATGYRSMFNNADGSGNVAQGAYSLYNNCSFLSGPNPTKGLYNVGIGAYSLYSNDVISEQTAIGHSALYSNTQGLFNTANGYKTLYFNTVGSRNTAAGFKALYTNGSTSGGNDNSAAGSFALYLNQIGSENSALGTEALYNNISGKGNSAMGYRALYNNQFGSENTAIGTRALYKTTASGNLGVGREALYENTSSFYNLAIGVDAMRNNQLGSNNIGIGTNALLGLVSNGGGNIGLGSWALANVGVSGPNGIIGVGALSGFGGTSGLFNVDVGYQTNLASSYDNYCVAVGSYASVTGFFKEAVAVGANALCNASKKARFGDINTIKVESTGDYRTLSDGRFKYNVKAEDVKGLDFILKLRPVNYTFNREKFADFVTKDMPDSVAKIYKEKVRPDNSRHTGFIAQEVEAAAREVGYDFYAINKPRNEREYYNVSYATFVVPLVKAVQEQQMNIESNVNITDNLLRILDNLENSESLNNKTRNVNIQDEDSYLISLDNSDKQTIIISRVKNQEVAGNIKLSICNAEGNLLKAIELLERSEMRYDLSKIGVGQNELVIAVSINNKLLGIKNINLD